MAVTLVSADETMPRITVLVEGIMMWNIQLSLRFYSSNVISVSKPAVIKKAGYTYYGSLLFWVHMWCNILESRSFNFCNHWNLFINISVVNWIQLTKYNNLMSFCIKDASSCYAYPLQFGHIFDWLREAINPFSWITSRFTRLDFGGM